MPIQLINFRAPDFDNRIQKKTENKKIQSGVITRLSKSRRITWKMENGSDRFLLLSMEVRIWANVSLFLVGSEPILWKQSDILRMCDTDFSPSWSSGV